MVKGSDGNATISVVTITYNDAEGFKRTAESVLSQGRLPDQWIVIDGGSTDGTRTILNQLPSWVNWTSAADRGRYDAMNKGLLRCTSDLVWLLHGGDSLAHLDVIGQVLLSYAQHDWLWAYGDAVISSTGNQPDRVWTRKETSTWRYSLGGLAIPHQATVMTRGLVARLGEYSTSFGLAADQEYMLRAHRVSAPAKLDGQLVVFDAGGAGSSRPTWAHFLDMRRARRNSGTKVPFDALLTILVLVTGLARAAVAKVRAAVAMVRSAARIAVRSRRSGHDFAKTS